jgi:hypothetical protein
MYAHTLYFNNKCFVLVTPKRSNIKTQVKNELVETYIDMQRSTRSRRSAQKLSRKFAYVNFNKFLNQCTYCPVNNVYIVPLNQKFMFAFVASLATYYANPNACPYQAPIVSVHNIALHNKRANDELVMFAHKFM